MQISVFVEASGAARYKISGRAATVDQCGPPPSDAGPSGNSGWVAGLGTPTHTHDAHQSKLSVLARRVWLGTRATNLAGNTCETAMAEVVAATAAAEPGLEVLLARCSFGPEKVVPKTFAFVPMGAKKNDEKRDKKKSKQEGNEDDNKLSKRVSIDQLSSTVGHRAAGVQSGMVKYLVEKFKQDFTRSAMEKVVLPQCGGLPYVTAEKEPRLPCQNLSSMNAIKICLKVGASTDWQGFHPRARRELEALKAEGLQLEWQQYKSYFEWMEAQIEASSHREITLKMHLVDTALLYAQYCMSQAAMSALRALIPLTGTMQSTHPSRP